MSKGSKPRPIEVPLEQYDSNWNAIFKNTSVAQGESNRQISACINNASGDDNAKRKDKNTGL